MQVKLFAGEPEKVERAINRWADDGQRRDIASIMPLPGKPGEVTLMFIFNPVAAPGAIVPVARVAGNGIVH